MVGKETMGIYGWKQLILWSLEHACLSQQEYKTVRREWEKLWQKFLQDVDEAYGAELDAVSRGTSA
jgi:adenosine deaminase CECR1